MTKFLCGILIFWAGLPSFLHAYTEATHERIVIDAVKFVIDAKDITVRYPDGLTAQSDYETLSKVLLGNAKRAPGNQDTQLLSKARFLGEAAAHTDRTQDVWVDFQWGQKPVSNSGSRFTSYTVLSHFLNVRTPGVLWSHDGLFAQRVLQNPECTNQAYVDLFTNAFFEPYPPKKINLDRSSPYLVYRGNLRPGVEQKDYDVNFKQEVQYVRFWPLQNMAEHWYQQFVLSGSSDQPPNTPFNLSFLGPVLHAVQDATVPYHSAGISGCGHVEYENFVTAIYLRDSKLYDRNRIRSHLFQRDFLRKKSSIVQIVEDLARYSSARCQCKLNYCSCPILNNEAIAKDLVNLAIAANVLVLRKSLSDWQQETLKKGEQTQSGNSVGLRRVATAPAAEIIGQQSSTAASVRPLIDIDRRSAVTIVWSPEESSGSKFQTNLVEAARSISKVTDVPVTLDVTGPEDVAIPAAKKIRVWIGTAKESIYDFSKGKISSQQLRRNLDTYVQNISKIGQQAPELRWNPLAIPHGTTLYPDMPPVSEPSVTFRLPTKDETENPKSWNQYRERLVNFYRSVELLDVFTLRSGTKVQLDKATDKQEEAALLETFEKLGTLQEKIMKKMSSEKGGK